MKPIILSDQSTSLNCNDVFVVNYSKSEIGQIVYTLDQISSTGTNIIYLSNEKIFPMITKACKKIVSMHEKNSIIVINIDSVEDKFSFIKQLSYFNKELLEKSQIKHEIITFNNDLEVSYNLI